MEFRQTVIHDRRQIAYRLCDRRATNRFNKFRIASVNYKCEGMLICVKSSDQCLVEVSDEQ